MKIDIKIYSENLNLIKECENWNETIKFVFDLE